jgi:hypothetical protein
MLVLQLLELQGWRGECLTEKRQKLLRVSGGQLFKYSPLLLLEAGHLTAEYCPSLWPVPAGLLSRPNPKNWAALQKKLNKPFIQYPPHWADRPNQGDSSCKKIVISWWASLDPSSRM